MIDKYDVNKDNWNHKESVQNFEYNTALSAFLLRQVIAVPFTIP